MATPYRGFGKSIGPFFRVWGLPIDPIMTPADGTDRLSRNVGKELRLYAA